MPPVRAPLGSDGAELAGFRRTGRDRHERCYVNSEFDRSLNAPCCPGSRGPSPIAGAPNAWLDRQGRLRGSVPFEQSRPAKRKGWVLRPTLSSSTYPIFLSWAPQPSQALPCSFAGNAGWLPVSTLSLGYQKALASRCGRSFIAAKALASCVIPGSPVSPKKEMSASAHYIRPAPR